MPKDEGCLTIKIRDRAVVKGLRVAANAAGATTIDEFVTSILRVAFRAALEAGKGSKLGDATE